MPRFFESFGLEMFNDEESYKDLVFHVVNNGRALPNYYNSFYFNKEYGKVQLIVPTNLIAPDKLEGYVIDTHSPGNAYWKVPICSLDNNYDKFYENAGKLQRRIVVKNPESGEGTIVCNLVNSEVLPSYLEDDLIEMQVIGLAEKVTYYPDEAALLSANPGMAENGRLRLDYGRIIPLGLLMNRNEESLYYHTSPMLENTVHIVGKIKGFYEVYFELSEKYYCFAKCLIDTELGPLEVVHSLSQITEEQQNHMHGGAIMDFRGIISGDVAINEYAGGMIRDELHDLMALRYVFCGGDAERMRSILSKDAVYEAKYNNRFYRGADEIIERLKYVQENTGRKYFAHMAETASVPEDGDAPAYEAGKKCIALATGEKDKYQSIAFIDVDDSGMITRLTTSKEICCDFRLI